MRLLLLVAILLAAAPAASARTRVDLDPLPETSVGRVSDTSAFIGISLRGERLRVYACDGTLKRDPTISVWFRSGWDGQHALRLRRDGHTLRLRPDLSGRLDAHAFRTRHATMPAGLFRGHRKRVRMTWVVLRNGHKRGTMVPTRKPCRFVLVTSANGQQQWVSVCN
jgi:hypothetical protein